MIFPLLFSCTTEETQNETPAIQPHLKVMTGYPENKANIYDLAGKLHNDLCLAYETAPMSLFSVEDAIWISDSLATSNPQFQQLTLGGLTSVSSSRLAFIMQSSENALQVIDDVNISQKARISLVNFLSTIEIYKTQGAEYDAIYQFIIAYEDSISQDSSLSSQDKQIIFTTSSIARYAHHFASLRKKKPPRDKDWDANIGNITAGTDGAEESMAKAVSMSVAASLYSNR